MQRKEAMIGAGTLTGLLIFTVAALGLGPSVLAPDAQAAQAVTTPVVAMPVVATQSAPTPAAGALQAPEVQRVIEQNEQLRQTVQLMQEREAAYRAQLEAANQAIVSLQLPAPVVVEEGAANPAAWTEEREDEEHEAEEGHEHEDDDHDDGEHEDEHESGEHDD
jgi:hypothetical protein